MASTLVRTEARKLYKGRSGQHWEAVIGLEVHVELNTRSKLFSSAPNHFGDAPNTNISVVDTGQPGALPVLNREAVRKAVQLGCAIEARVANFSKFDRKSYFYPDSPRNFQITQYDEPIIIGGRVATEVNDQEISFSVEHVHLEDDAGMLKHFGSHAGVDYNRAGVPLLEIVSDPCMQSPDEAIAYAMALRSILQYIDASDCNMQEGSLRMDANVSVRPQGESGLRAKSEIKNMNSFNFMGMALESEIRRQIDAYESQPDKDPAQVHLQSTYRWDPDRKENVLMRRKESADDYRYFPEPDLPPIVLTNEYIESVRSSLPELPKQRKARYVEKLQLSEHSAWVITSDKALADYFEDGLQHTKNARALCNWITIEMTGRLKDSDHGLLETGIPAKEMAELVERIDSGKITGKIAKKVADELIAAPSKTVDEIISANPDYQPLSDSGEIEKLVDQVLTENSAVVEEIKSGMDRKFPFLVGQVMKLSRGKANPQIVNELLKKKLGS